MTGCIIRISTFLFIFCAALVTGSGLTLAGIESQKEKPYFVLLRPDKDHPFWALFQHAMEAACDDLGCEVEALLAGWDHYRMLEDAKQLGGRDRKPDMVFFQSFKQNGDAIIKALDEAGIKSFLMNAGLTQEQSLEMGKPREKYQHWIAQMMPDDYGAGISTAEALYQEAKNKGYVNAKGKVLFAAIEGNSADGASIERLRGLHHFIKNHDDIELLQVVQGKWETDLSKRLATSLLRRYQDLHVIWAAGDPIAFGIVDAAQQMGRNVLTAGVDWAPRALEEIEAGRMVGSAGGHFMEGAWVAVAGYDYIMGYDFAEKEGVELKSIMGFLSKSTVNSYVEKFGAGDLTAIDFKKLSRAYNSGLEGYVFDMSPWLD